MSYTCYTDGSAIHNPGPGGRAWIVIENNVIIKSGSGGVRGSTNNKMELQAVIELLKSFILSYTKTEESGGEGLFSTSDSVKTKTEILIQNKLTVITDSTYVQKGVTEWLEVWIRRGWRRSKGGKLIANVEQWKELSILLGYFEEINWLWTKAHVGTKWNERVDTEARSQAMHFNSL